MTQSPILFVRLLAIAWCVAYPLATAGCARHKTDAALAAPAPAPEPRLPVALRVTNSNWSDVRIYVVRGAMWLRDRKSTRLNSSHTVISYAVFCLKKKTMRRRPPTTRPQASLKHD